MRTRCKPYSSNSVRRWKTASRVLQETWYDDGSGWKKAGVYDRASCGYIKTSTSPAANAQVEFRIDCDNVTFSGIDVAVIKPGGYYYSGDLGYMMNDFRMCLSHSCR
jgi:hypothetical protein